jgi:hypothetical protein
LSNPEIVYGYFQLVEQLTENYLDQMLATEVFPHIVDLAVASLLNVQDREAERAVLMFLKQIVRHPSSQLKVPEILKSLLMVSYIILLKRIKTTKAKQLMISICNFN